MGPRRDDSGSVLVLVIGFFGVLLVLVAVVVNVSVVVLAKRGASSAADGAAVSAAQSLDLGVLYDQGLLGRIPLSPTRARARVAAYEATAQRQQPGLQLGVVVDVGARTATVTATRSVDLPFDLPGSGPVSVRAVATARAPVV